MIIDPEPWDSGVVLQLFFETLVFYGRSWRCCTPLSNHLLTPDTGWWFGTFFVFPYIGKNNPNWLSYVSEGLNPPTRIFLKHRRPTDTTWYNIWILQAKTCPKGKGMPPKHPTFVCVYIYTHRYTYMYTILYIYFIYIYMYYYITYIYIYYIQYIYILYYILNYYILYL